MGKIELKVQCPVCNHRHTMVLTETTLLDMLQALSDAQKKAGKRNSEEDALRSLMDIFGMN